MDGKVYTFKARLVAKGFTQTCEVDYEETFSPVADIRAIRILIAIASYYDYDICQMDVKTAFLNGHLSKEVYMEKPKGFVSPKFPNHGGDIKWELKVTCYTDTGYLTDVDDSKSQTGYVFVLNGAKYIAASDASKEAVRIRKFISGLGVVPTNEKSMTMYYDNTGDITIANEPGITKGAKHYRTKVHYLREVIELGDIRLDKVYTDDNVADPFTMALDYKRHFSHTSSIGLLPASSLL
ncbi:zinc finger, CCHC-type containing protein [Tanacetum coccineum]